MDNQSNVKGNFKKMLLSKFKMTFKQIYKKKAKSCWVAARGLKLAALKESCADVQQV